MHLTCVFLLRRHVECVVQRKALPQGGPHNIIFIALRMNINSNNISLAKYMHECEHAPLVGFLRTLNVNKPPILACSGCEYAPLISTH